ncbi:hypothetical protein ACQR1Y_07800 [Bradyrhizobium sp. HKCCYLRH3099]|uniref:hypothetical protein n=1 Tax=unclassified Bradyrhizobium TaxID=2631580 RepID=UPI003EBBE72D
MIAELRLQKERALHLVPAAVAVLILLLILPWNEASASDFVLTYAVEAKGTIDTGKLTTCDYERICEIQAADLIIELIFHRGTRSLSTIDMRARGALGCCFSVDGDQQFHAFLDAGSVRFAIYRRVEIGRDEFVRSAFVQYEREGTIHLRFLKTN